MAGKHGICKLCLQQKKLIHAHIMPKCFQKPVRGDDNSLYLYHADSNRYQDTFDYLYDKSLLCATCDNTFSASENYAANFFDDVRTDRRKPDRVVQADEATEFYYILEVGQIKKALLSILWRMSVTGHKRYGNVSLGALQDELRNRLNDTSLMEPGFFPISIVSIKDLGDARADLIPTYVPSFDHLGSLVYQIQLPGFLIFIHVTASAKFDPSKSSIEDDSTFVIVEEMNKGSIKHLDRTFFIPYIPKSKR